MSMFCCKYKREVILLLICIVAIYGFPLLFRLLPAGSLPDGDILLRISAGIVFAAVVWYSFSAQRRFLPVLAVGILSVGMRRSLYGNSMVMLASRTSESTLSAVFSNLLLIAVAAAVGLLLGYLLNCRRKRKK